MFRVTFLSRRKKIIRGLLPLTPALRASVTPTHCFTASGGRTPLLLCVALCAITFFSGCAKQSARGLTIKEGVLAVGVEVGYPPMEYLAADGVTLAGFDIELVKALARKLNLRAQFIDTAWEGILPGLDTGKYDIAINITILPERQKKYNFTKPYIDSSIAIVTRAYSPLVIQTPEDIAGCRVSYQSDTTAQYFTEKLHKQGIVFSPFAYDKVFNCFGDLEIGRVDLVVSDNLVAFDYAGKADSPFEVVWQGPSDEVIGICLKKGNDTLTGALNTALDELFADGTLVTISEKIFNADLVSPVRNYSRYAGNN